MTGTFCAPGPLDEPLPPFLAESGFQSVPRVRPPSCVTGRSWGQCEGVLLKGPRHSTNVIVQLTNFAAVVSLLLS